MKKITIDTHISIAFDKVVEDVEVLQEYSEHGKLLGNQMRISLPFKCDPSSTN